MSNFATPWNVSNVTYKRDGRTVRNINTADCAHVAAVDAESHGVDLAASIVTAVNAYKDHEAELATLRAQNALLEEEIARLTKLTSPAWFYFDDDQCRFGVHEIIDEDFCWDNRKTGEHVIEIATAGPLPTIWAHVKFLTDEEKAALETDDDYILTEYSTETEARNALAQVAK